MKSERLLRKNGNAIGLFRQVFKNTVSQFAELKQDFESIKVDEFLKVAEQRKDLMSWEFANMDVSEQEKGHFTEVMMDYRESLIDCLSQHEDQSYRLTVCLHTLFS